MRRNNLKVMEISALRCFQFPLFLNQISWLCLSMSKQVFLWTDCYVWRLNQYFVVVRCFNPLIVYDSTNAFAEGFQIVGKYFWRAPPIVVTLVRRRKNIHKIVPDDDVFASFQTFAEKFLQSLVRILRCWMKAYSRHCDDFSLNTLRSDVESLSVVLLKVLDPMRWTI